MLNRWKRLLALLASVAVLFSLCTAASAAPGEQAEPRELTEADYAAARRDLCLAAVGGRHEQRRGGCRPTPGRSAIGWRQPTASGRARSLRTAAA